MIGSALRPAIPVLALLVGACAGGSGDYPSLAIRDAERVSASGDPVASQTVEPPAPPVDETTTQRIARLVAEARASHARFEQRSAGLRAPGRAPSNTPPESWISAQVALSDLVSMRSGTILALTELDTLYVEERMAYPGEPSPLAVALEQARQTVSGLVAEENATITRLVGA